MSHAPVPDLCFYGLICFHLSSSPSSILFDLFSQPLLLLNNMVVLLMASFSLCNISLTCAFAYVRNDLKSTPHSACQQVTAHWCNNVEQVL